MNLALVIEAFGAMGGAERMAGYLASGLIARGHAVHVYAAKFEGKTGVVEHRVSAKGLNRHVAFSNAVKKAMEKHDVVYSFTRTVTQDILRLGGGIHAEYLKRMEAARSMLGRFFSRINPKERAILRLEREGLEKTPRIVAVSNRVKEEAIRHYRIVESKIQVMHNGVDLQRFHPSLRLGRAEWLKAARVPEGFLVLFAGSGFRRKGLNRAIEAVSRIRGARLLVCGKDNAEPFEAYAKKLHVHAHFLGARKDIESAYAAADVLVLPAYYDPFPNVCLEAMACGTPVVVSPVCGPSEVITHGADSFVAEQPEEIAACLERLKSSDLRAAARATAEKHPIDAYLERTLALFTPP